MDSFRIGTFNLFNLVKPEVKYYGNRSYSQNAYGKKVRWVSEQLNSMKSDIVGFQEIFHKDVLHEALKMTNKFNPENLVVPYEAGDSPVVGLATIFPLKEEAKSIKGIPSNVVTALNSTITEFSRPVLKAKLTITEDLDLTVFVCHLKSKRPDFNESDDYDDFSAIAIGEARSLIRRGIEAAGIRQLVLEETKGTKNPVVLMGDLNDSTRSVTNNIISGPQPKRFDRIKNKKKYWDNLLYSVYDIVSQKSYKVDWPTHIHNGHYETLDHIYVSEEFSPLNRKRKGEIEFVHIFDDHLKNQNLREDELPIWQSDHGQVVAKISLK